MGACSATTEKDADYLMDNNFRYTQTLAEWCLEHNVYFQYASSAETYGDGLNGFEDTEEDFYKSLLTIFREYQYIRDIWE